MKFYNSQNGFRSKICHRTASVSQNPNFVMTFFDNIFVQKLTCVEIKLFEINKINKSEMMSYVSLVNFIIEQFLQKLTNVGNKFGFAQKSNDKKSEIMF